MKSGKAYKHYSFKDLALLVTKVRDSELGLDLEASWVVVGINKDTILPEKILMLINYSDIPKWKEYPLKDRVVINEFLVRK